MSLHDRQPCRLYPRAAGSIAPGDDQDACSLRVGGFSLFFFFAMRISCSSSGWSSESGLCLQQLQRLSKEVAPGEACGCLSLPLSLWPSPALPQGTCSFLLLKKSYVSLSDVHPNQVNSFSLYFSFFVLAGCMRG